MKSTGERLYWEGWKTCQPKKGGKKLAYKMALGIALYAFIVFAFHNALLFNGL